jgi:archaeal flagellar protein FlaJ
MEKKGVREDSPKKEIKKLPKKKIAKKKSFFDRFKKDEFTLSSFEKTTLKRLKVKEEKKKVTKEKTARGYLRAASKMFNETSSSLQKKKSFDSLKQDLVKSNMQFLPANYISMTLFTTLISVGVAFFIFLFFLIFTFDPFPLVKFASDGIFNRILKFFWIIFVIPLVTFFSIYTYPSLEKKSIEARIDRELPFATIHMSSISGSMVEPSKIFSIIIATKEYPYIEKELIKLLNETNVLGYDLVTALRNRAFNCPSRKLAEIFNGLATTITSGGNLPEFFNKRSESLMFEYKIEKEKQTRSSETFMDIYISVVIAAPMILMLLLMMMKISGLGISMSTNMISLIMVLGVLLINVVFIMFLHLKQPEGAG